MVYNEQGMMQCGSHLALCCLLVTAVGCGSGKDGTHKDAGSVFPVNQIADIMGSTSGATRSTDGNKVPVEVRGFAVDVDGQNLHVAEEQVVVQDTQVGGVISANANNADGKVFAFTFSFVTLNQAIPKEYELSTNPQDLDSSTAVINYSELVSDGTVPVAAQSVANGVFKLEEFSSTVAVGNFSMDIVLTGGDLRKIKNGTFRISRKTQ